ncbi:hypothetical protein Hanom_Chr10g00935031 [Helianthus anomalus]
MLYQDAEWNFLHHVLGLNLDLILCLLRVAYYHHHPKIVPFRLLRVYKERVSKLVLYKL